MKIGILQTGLAPDALKDKMGDYPEMFARLLGGHGSVVVRPASDRGFEFVRHRRLVQSAGGGGRRPSQLVDERCQFLG